MADIESLLNRWQTAGVLDAETAGRIRAHEAAQKKPAGLRWQVIVVLILGAILLACGVVLFVSAHWDQIGPVARLAVVLAVRLAVVLAGSLAFWLSRLPALELSERPAFVSSKTLAFPLAESLASSPATVPTCAVPTRANASRAWVARVRAITRPPLPAL